MVQKGDIYYLKDEEGRQVVKFVVEEVRHSPFGKEPTSIDGKCYVACGWTMDPLTEKYVIADDWEFFIDGYFKWDSCTHWHYYGEDYIPDGSGDKDGYYHICGPHCLHEHMLAQCFIWKLMEQCMHSDSTTSNYYSEYEKLNKIIDMMLDGYSIVKEDSKDV